MAKKKKLNSNNPKYMQEDVKVNKIKKEIIVNNIKGVIIKAIWYEQN
jgi:hypothetical protein